MANVNLGRIPHDWGEYETYGKVRYDGDPQIFFVDNNVQRTAGNPSIRSEAHTNVDPNRQRELDGRWIPCKPGDHVVVRVWIKTNPSGGNVPPNPYSPGGRLGVDYYGHTSAGYGILFKSVAPASQMGLPGYYSENVKETITGFFSVPWGKDWTMVGWDAIIPSDFCGAVDAGGIRPCDPVQVDSFVCWLDVRPVGDSGVVWFADGELYINPTGEPSENNVAAKVVAGIAILTIVAGVAYVATRER